MQGALIYCDRGRKSRKNRRERRERRECRERRRERRERREHREREAKNSTGLLKLSIYKPAATRQPRRFRWRLTRRRWPPAHTALRHRSDDHRRSVVLLSWFHGQVSSFQSWA